MQNPYDHTTPSDTVASVPVLTFVSCRGAFVYECQNQRDTSKYRILVSLSRGRYNSAAYWFTTFGIERPLVNPRFWFSFWFGGLIAKFAEPMIRTSTRPTLMYF